MAAAAYFETVQKIYIAFYQRPADPAGLKYWAEQIDLAGGNPNAVITAFGTQPESIALYGEVTAANIGTVLDKIYQAAFSRTPAEAEKAYWIEQFNAGGITASSMALAVVLGAQNADAASVANKLTVANEFTAQVDGNALSSADFGVAPFAVTYVGDADADAARAILKPVTGDTATILTPAQITEQIKATIADPSDPINAQTFTLTTGVDNIVGTAADEVITGVVSAAIAEGTLQGTDAIDGVGGNDTLKLDMQKTFDGFTTGSMKNVKTVNLTNKSVGAIDFVAKGVTGVTSYVVDSTKGAVNLKSLAELAAVDIKGPTGDSTFAVEYAATSTVATGTQTDTQVLKVTDVGTINTAAAGAATNAKFMDVTIAKVEALDLTTAGAANSLNLAGLADAKTYKVSGAGQTEIEAVGAAITSFDASGATGTVIANLEGAAASKLATVKAGAGNDVITVALDDLTTTATIDGGAGTDRLDITSSAGKTLQTTMSGVESIRFTAPADVKGAVVFSGTNVSDLAKAEFKAGALAGAVSFVNQKATAFEVLLEGAVTGNTVSADAAAAITANISNTATATGQATADTALAFDNATGLTVNVNKLMEYKGAITTGTKGAVTVNVASNVVNNAETTEFTGTLTAAAATSVTINADGGLDHHTTAGNGADITAGKATTVTIKAGATSAAAVNLVAGEATTLNLTVGSKGLDMDGAGATATSLAKVQTLTATNSGHVDFTGVALSAVSSATVTGSGESKATFAALGDAAQTYNLNLTVTGQKNGLTTAAVDAGTGAATVNISGVTGNTVMTTIKGAAGVTLNANKLAGTFNNGANGIQATAGNVTIDVGSMEKAADIAKTSTIIAGDAGGAASNTKGDVTLTATNVIGAVTTGVITGNNVSIDATNALGAVTIGTGLGDAAATDIFAKTSVTYKGATLSTANNKADIQAVNSSTALTVDLSGAAGAEVFTVTGSTAQESITVKGNVGTGTNSVAVTLGNQTSDAKTQTVDLSGFTGSDKTTTTTSTVLSAEVDGAITYKGSAMNDTITIKAPAGHIEHSKAISLSDTTLTDSDTLVLNGNLGKITLTNLSLSGIEKLNVADDTNAITINASAVSAKAMEFSSGAANDILNLTGTPGDDVIDLSSLTKAATAPDLVIKGGAGNDAIVASVMKDTFVFEATAALNGVDTITGFAKATDIINWAQGGSKVAVTGTLTTTADAFYQLGGLTAGNADTASAVATAVTAGATWTAAAATAWIAVSDDNSTAIYQWTDVAGTDGVQVGELTLVGTIDAAMTTAELGTATTIV